MNNQWLIDNNIPWNYVGCDEAGRGCLAGPVVAAAVILPEQFKLPKLNDSKIVKLKDRIQLRNEIEEQAIAIGIGICSPEEIDKHNILWASVLAMHKALDQIKHIPEIILIDGNKFRSYKNWPHKTVVKGDLLVPSISAASIMAKTERDFIMEKLHDEFPIYNWKQNVGYPTIAHRKAIQEYGSCIHHRKSFRLLPEQKTLF